MPNAVTPPKSLLDPQRSVLVLIDHQPMTLFGVHSHDAQSVVNNTVALAKTANAFGIPTILTTVAAQSIGGDILPELQAVFPEQTPIDRSWINCWEDPVLRDAVLATGRDQIVIAGLWTEMCVAFPALSAREEGFDVFVVADASGGASPEAHERAMQRIVGAGVVPLTAQVFLGELQRDWSRTETYADATAIATEHFGNWGQVIRYFQQLSRSNGSAAQDDSRRLAA